MVLRTVRVALVLSGCVLAGACSIFDAGQQPAPAASSFMSTTGKAAFYVVVERGQSLDQIAKMYRVSKQRIALANKLRSPFRLKPGAELEIPLNSSLSRTVTTSGGKATTVQRGTAVASAKRRNVVPETKQAKAKRHEPEIIALDDPT